MSEAEKQLGAARAASAAGDWPGASAAYLAARDASASLSPDDELAWSDAAWWLGDNDTTLVTERAWNGFLASGRNEDAAMAAMSIAGVLFLRGDVGPGGAISPCSGVRPRRR